MDARTPDGRAVRRLISIGSYKTVPNNVLTSTGEIHYFTSPEQVKPEMTDLLDWYREAERKGEHAIVLAAVFHYRFVRIHPFDDEFWGEAMRGATPDADVRLHLETSRTPDDHGGGCRMATPAGSPRRNTA